jgi:amino acid transporter
MEARHRHSVGIAHPVRGHGSGLGYVPAVLVSMLMTAFVMYGFDSAAELSEQTRDPHKTAPSPPWASRR